MNIKIPGYFACACMLFVGSTTFCASQETMSTDAYRFERAIEAQLAALKAEVKTLLPRLEDDQIISLVESIGQNVGVERSAEVPALIENILTHLEREGGESYTYREREIIEMVAYAHAQKKGIAFDTIPDLLQGARRERVALEKLEHERIIAGHRGVCAQEVARSDADSGDSSGFETAQEELSEDEFYDAQDVPQNRVLGHLQPQLQQMIFDQVDPSSLRAAMDADKGAAEALADMKIGELLHKSNYDAQRALFNLAKNPDFKEWPLPALRRVLQYLLDHGVGIDEKDNYRLTALMVAATYGYNNLIEALLAAGLDPRVRDNYRRTALHWAADNGHIETVGLLLPAGVDPSLPDNYTGMTALHLAADNGHIETVGLLLAAGVDPSLPDNYRRIALHLAARNGHAEIVEALLAAGVDPSLRVNGGWTALHFAAMRGHAGIVEVLLAAGVDPSLRDNLGWTALHFTAQNGHAGIVEVLLAVGVDPRLQDNNEGRTVLHLAAVNGHAGIVEVLLAAGVDPSLRDNYGQTALHLAALNGHAGIVERLLAGGADPSLRDNNGRTALDIAKERNHADVVVVLKRKVACVLQ